MPSLPQFPRQSDRKRRGGQWPPSGASGAEGASESAGPAPSCAKVFRSFSKQRLRWAENKEDQLCPVGGPFQDRQARVREPTGKTAPQDRGRAEGGWAGAGDEVHSPGFSGGLETGPAALPSGPCGGSRLTWLSGERDDEKRQRRQPLSRAPGHQALGHLAHLRAPIAGCGLPLCTHSVRGE